jgi:hypothetical protein
MILGATFWASLSQGMWMAEQMSEISVETKEMAAGFRKNSDAAKSTSLLQISHSNSP